MPISVRGEENGSIISIIFSLDSGTSGDFDVQIAPQLVLSNATYVGTDLLVSGSISSDVAIENNLLTDAVELSILGSVSDNTDVFAYTFSTDGPGSIQVSSLFVLTQDFEGSNNEATDLITVTFGGVEDDLSATPGPDTLSGTPGPELVLGLEGNDTFEASAGNDTLDGGEGIDTVAYNGPQASYTVTISPGDTTVQDRRDGGDGLDTLRSIETLGFEGDAAIAPLDLTKFGGAGGLGLDDFLALTELYIAYYDRAPDALGLNFWATVFARGLAGEEGGLSLEGIAADFATQPETLAAFPSDVTNEQFATTVYENVLGRTPDADGLAFWVSALDSGNTARDVFILRVLEGAKAEPDPSLGQEFIDQQLADRAYLAEKVEVGSYFAVNFGLSNLDAANAVMDTYGDASTRDYFGAGEAAVDAFDAAMSDATPEFLMPVIGVLPDDFFDTFNSG